MSTFDYDKARATSLRLLNKFGNALSLIRVNTDPDDYDPIAGTFFPAPDTTLTGVGVLLNFDKKEINNDTIKATDRKLLYQGEEIKIGDKYNGWRVHNIDNLDPDESGTILTTAQMRK
jgi:hypothetical protein